MTVKIYPVYSPQEYPKWYKSEKATIWVDLKDGVTSISNAWVCDGSTGWFIKPEERQMDPVKFLEQIESEYQDHKFLRCIKCGKLMPVKEVAGYPLFAGVACSNCWEIHQTALQKQKESGHVCRFCHRPYNDCCC